MRAKINLGRIWGIPIGLHPTWFLVFGLITWSLAAGYFPTEYPQLSSSMHWLLGAITSLFFFGSVLLHELGHAYFALRNGLKVEGITLFIFGGVAQLSDEPRSPGAEFRIALAGPLVSLALALVFGALWLLDQNIPWLAAPSIWLWRTNLLLAAFNMIPGFPLDGGRVFRAFVWRLTGSRRRATRVAAAAGQIVAYAFIGGGFLIALNVTLISGLWLAFIGWFLLNAASATVTSSELQEALTGLKVRQVMRADWPEVPGRLPLSQVVNEQMLQGGARYAFIRRDGYGYEPAPADGAGENGGAQQPHGMLTLTDVMRVPAAGRGRIPAEQVMVPWEKLVAVESESNLLDAMRLMETAGVGQLPVTEGGRLVGVLPREQVMHAIRLRSDLALQE